MFLNLALYRLKKKKKRVIALSRENDKLRKRKNPCICWDKVCFE